MPTEPNQQDQAEYLRDALVAGLVRQGAIRSSAVGEAFATVPRHLFVPQADLAAAYADWPVFIRWDAETPISSSTQPTMMAIMIEQLCLEPGNRVLEIGAGSGYNAAIMAHIVGDTGNVITVDIDRDIVDEAAANLSKTGFHNVTCVCGDGFEGVPMEQPYDRVIVTVGAYDVSPHWVDQLKDGGILVAPLWFRGANLSVALQKRGGRTCRAVCVAVHVHPDSRGLAAHRGILSRWRPARRNPANGHRVGLRTTWRTAGNWVGCSTRAPSCAKSGVRWRASSTLRTSTPACSCSSRPTPTCTTSIHHPRVAFSRAPV